MRFFEFLYDPVITDANVYEVRKLFEESPRESTWPLSQEVDISRTTVHRVIHNDLKLFPYKLQIHQTQTNVNKEEKSEFFQTISERIENNPGDFGLFWFCFVTKPIFIWLGMSQHEVLVFSSAS